MQNTTEKSSRSAEGLYKFFIYFVLVLLAVTIIVPVAWVFMASIKQNAEFYGNPWALPAGFYWQNFVNAWNGAKMGEYMLNSVIVTALALALLLVVALPAAYCLSRFHFKGCKVLNTLFMAGLFINVNYIVVPIFLMLRDGDVWLKSHFGSGFLLNNLREQMYRYRIEYLKDVKSRRSLVEEHDALYERMKNRDLAGAQKMIREHIERQQESIMQTVHHQSMTGVEEK